MANVKCRVCHEPSSRRCSRCKSAYYCSKGHQKVDWRTHKKTCAYKPLDDAPSHHDDSGTSCSYDGYTLNDIQIPIHNMSASSLSPFVTGTWYEGVDPKDQYEWLTNCYQLRCDDDYTWGGCYLHGPYDPSANIDSITEDFLVFCLLVGRNNFVPPKWNWGSFLNSAGKWAGFAFEKCDAKERWGPMSAILLRATAEKVYGSCASVDDECSEENRKATEDAEQPFRKNPALEEVGGISGWNGFKSSLKKFSKIRFNF